MRLLLISLVLIGSGLTSALAQNTGTTGGAPQLPVGQTFKQFEYPYYEDGKLKATLNAVEARGITLNRAETTELKIEVYDNDVISTTVTSPKADLYVAEQKMRTKNTVKIERTDMDATSQNCDFDLKTKKYILRDHVRVVLKHLDVGSGGPASDAHTVSSGTPPATTPVPAITNPAASTHSILESPGSASTPSPSP